MCNVLSGGITVNNTQAELPYNQEIVRTIFTIYTILLSIVKVRREGAKSEETSTLQDFPTTHTRPCPDYLLQKSNVDNGHRLIVSQRRRVQSIVDKVL